MTFTFPEEVASSFVRAIGPTRRSRFVVEAVEAKLLERERILIDACEAANHDPETQEIQREMAALPDIMMEAWDESEISPAR